jgi:hypothetical protein
MWPFQKGKVKAKENAESDFARFNTGFLNKLFYKIFLIEKSLLKIVRFPVGVSITLMIKK